MRTLAIVFEFRFRFEISVNWKWFLSNVDVDRNVRLENCCQSILRQGSVFPLSRLN